MNVQRETFPFYVFIYIFFHVLLIGIVVWFVCRELSVSIAAHIAETVSEKLIEALSKSYKCLVSENRKYLLMFECFIYLFYNDNYRRFSPQNKLLRRVFFFTKINLKLGTNIFCLGFPHLSKPEISLPRRIHALVYHQVAWARIPPRALNFSS